MGVSLCTVTADCLVLVFGSTGLIVVSVAVRLSFEERVHFSGKLLLQPSLILFWSFSDPIHPQVMDGYHTKSLTFSNVLENVSSRSQVFRKI